jgi:hypothetical protein
MSHWAQRLMCLARKTNCAAMSTEWMSVNVKLPHTPIALALPQASVHRELLRVVHLSSSWLTMCIANLSSTERGFKVW